MDNKKIIVRLITNNKIDKRLIETLNRFHFKKLYISQNKDSQYIIKYTDDKKITTFIDKNFQQTLSQDYFESIYNYFREYLNSYKKLNNKDDNSDEPLCDILSDKFEIELLKSFRIPQRNQKLGFHIALTHDVDYMGGYFLNNYKSAIVFLISFLKLLYKFKFEPFFIKYGLQFFFKRQNLQGIPVILEIAEKYGVKPVFFLFAKLLDNNKLNTIERLFSFNPDYDISDIDVQKSIKSIIDYGAEIGIHGSYKSALDTELLNNEKNQLEQIMSTKCFSVRQHYLNHYGNVTNKIYSKIGLSFDTTCGYVRKDGFLCGTTRPFYTKLNDENQNCVVVVPMIFMDAVSLYFKPVLLQEIDQNMKKLVDKVRKYNGFAAFNFHQRFFGCIPEIRKLYEELIEYSINSGGTISQLKDLNNIYLC